MTRTLDRLATGGDATGVEFAKSSQRFGAPVVLSEASPRRFPPKSPRPWRWTLWWVAEWNVRMS